MLFRVRYLAIFVVLITMLAAGCSSQDNSGSTQTGNDKDGGKANSSSGKQTELVMGTSSSGSSVQIMAIGMSDLISKQAGINTRAQSSGGSTATIQAIGADKIHFGLSSSPAVYFASRGQYIYKNKPISLEVLFGASTPEPRQIVYRPSKIKNPADFAGKKYMGKRSSLQDITLFSQAFVEAYEVDQSKIEMIDVTSTKEATKALVAGTVDAATLPGGLGSAPITEAFENADLSFVNFTEDKLKIILEKMGPSYSTAHIPKGTYKGQDEDILTPGTTTMMVTKKGALTEESAYAITKVLWENQDKLEAMHSSGWNWLAEDGKVPLMPVPYHEGSVKYFKEKGLWTDELQANQEKMAK